MKKTKRQLINEEGRIRGLLATISTMQTNHKFEVDSLLESFIKKEFKITGKRAYKQNNLIS